MTNEYVPGGALAAVRMARRCLMDAQFRLDDHGQECDLLNRLHGGAAVLLSVWQGRMVPRKRCSQAAALISEAWM
jgi:hypothetical protein